MSTIMVIPGSAMQIPLIKALKGMGYSVVCVNPYKDSPAFRYSDFYEQYDILDTEACLRVAVKYNVIAVISDECDIAMPTVAAVSEAIGLPSIGLELAKLYTNKRMMREFSKKNGFPCPAFCECVEIDEARKFFLSMKTKKMIIKPLDSNSSRGVYTIHNLKELEGVFDKALSFSHSKKAVLCEEYIEGTEFTVDGIVLNGVHYSLAVSKKKHYEYNPNIACELFFSHTDFEYDYEELMKQNNTYVNASGLPFGFTHAEYKYNGEEFVLIEIGARGGGNFISSYIVPSMTGIDNYKLLVQHTLSSNQNDKYELNEQYKERCCVLKFFDVEKQNEGKVLSSIEGEEILKNNPKILLYQFNIMPGEIINAAADDSKRIGFYIAYGDTRRELEELIKKIDEQLHFKC